MNSGIGPQIPESLRQLNQWAVYGPDKKPYRAQGLFADNRPIPWRPTDQNGNDTLRSIIEAEAHCRVIGGGFGPAFRMDARNGIVCFDIDDPDKARRGAAYDGLSAHDKEEYISMLHERNEMILRAFEGSGAYIEQSVSGKGFHILCEAVLPEGVSGYNMRGGGSIFTGDQFIYMTGGYGSVVNCQAIVNQLIMWFGANHEDRLQHFFPVEKLDVAIGSLLNLCETHGRQVNLEDDAVVQRLALINKKTNAAYLGQYDGDHSKAVRDLIGDLDKITGNVGQVERLVLGSNLLRMHPYTARGEDRAAKWRRLIPSVLAKCRPSNDSLYLKRAEEERAARELQARIAPVADAQNQSDVIGKLRKTLAKEVFEHFMSSAGVNVSFDLGICYPPSNMGALCREIQDRTRKATKWIVTPAVLSVVSAYVAQKYRGVDGSSLGVHFAGIADTGNGKTEVLNICRWLISNCVAGKSLHMEANRIIEAEAASSRGVYLMLKETGSIALMLDEAGSFLKTIMNPGESTDANTRRLAAEFRKAFDWGSVPGRHFDKLLSTYSENAKKQEHAPVPMPRMSTYLTTTGEDILDALTKGSVATGAVSRMMFCFHPNEDYRYSNLQVSPGSAFSFGCMTRMGTLIQEADVWGHGLSGILEPPPPGCDPASWPECVEIVWGAGVKARASTVASELDKHVTHIQRKQVGALPRHYVILNRVYANACRVASVVAIFNGSFEVDWETFSWAYHFVMINTCNLLKMYDEGLIGAEQDDFEAVLRGVVLDCMKKERKQWLRPNVIINALSKHPLLRAGYKCDYGSAKTQFLDYANDFCDADATGLRSRERTATGAGRKEFTWVV